MNAREKLYLVIIALLLGSAALFLGAVATAYLPLDVLRTSLDDVHGNFRYVLLAAFGLIGAVLLLFVTLRRNECVETLVQQGPLGEMRICFKAVENLVLKSAKEIKGVRETKTRIVASDNGLIIFLRAITYPDQNIPQVTAQLQTAVKDYVENTTGSTVAEIKVMIENVVTDAVKVSR